MGSKFGFIYVAEGNSLMAKLIDITGKAISGEWGIDDTEGTGIPVLRTSNFTNEGIVDYGNVVTRKILKKSLKEKFLQCGDTLIEKSGGSDKQPVGRVVFFEGEDNKYLFNNFTGRLRVINPQKWMPKYVFYGLYFNYIKGGTRAYENRTTGLHNLQLDSYIVSTSILDVPLKVQQQVVKNLDTLRQIIVKRHRQLEYLDKLIKARFVEMFDEPKTNINRYPISNLSDNIEFMTSGSRGWAKYCVENGSEWFVTIKNVKDCHISLSNMQHINAPNNAESKRTKLQEGDLLVSITADLGRTGVVTKEIAEYGAYINQHLICIRLNKAVLNPLYIAYFMESPAGKEQFESRNQSAVKAGLNFDSIKTLQVMIPPMKEQNKFVKFVFQIDKSRERTENS